MMFENLLTAESLIPITGLIIVVWYTIYSCRNYDKAIIEYYKDYFNKVNNFKVNDVIMFHPKLDVPEILKNKHFHITKRLTFVMDYAPVYFSKGANFCMHLTDEENNTLILSIPDIDFIRVSKKISIDELTSLFAGSAQELASNIVENKPLLIQKEITEWVSKGKYSQDPKGQTYYIDVDQETLTEFELKELLLKYPHRYYQLLMAEGDSISELEIEIVNDEIAEILITLDVSTYCLGDQALIHKPD